MAEITIREKDQKEEIEVLKVNIGEESFTIPLAGSLPLDTLKNLRTKEEMLDFLIGFIPEEIAKTITVADFGKIMNAWMEESKAAGGISLGELQASQGSLVNMPGL